MQVSERQRLVLRTALFIVILGTLPFYCVGFWLWGTAGQAAGRATPSAATQTPIGSDVILTAPPPSATPFGLQFGLTPTILSPLRPTPLQFIPPAGLPSGGGGAGTVILTPTAVFIPTSTLAPTLTPFPTDPPPPTATLAPPASETPLPFDPPTAEPPPAEPPPAEPPPAEPPPPEPPPPAGS